MKKARQKPQIDLQWVNRFTTPKKVAVEEFDKVFKKDKPPKPPKHRVLPSK